jgi:hypothetical protein
MFGSDGGRRACLLSGETAGILHCVADARRSADVRSAREDWHRDRLPNVGTRTKPEPAPIDYGMVLLPSTIDDKRAARMYERPIFLTIVF